MPRTEINPSIEVAIAQGIETLCFLPIAGESPAGIELSLGDLVTTDLGDGVAKHFLSGDRQTSPWWVLVEINGGSMLPFPAGALEPKLWQGLQRGDHVQVTGSAASPWLQTWGRIARLCSGAEQPISLTTHEQTL